MRYLLDTSVLVSLLRRHEATRVRFGARRPDEATYVSVVACGELARGVHRARSAVRRELRRSEVERLLAEIDAVLPIGQEIVEAYGQLTAFLDMQGTPIPTNDAWMAATALAHDLILVSDDGHFARVPDLVVENWAAG